MPRRKENDMVITFGSFTTTFYFLVTLIILGVIFEKQFIALEDKFDAWIAEKKQEAKNENRRTEKSA
jgi:hypothetical protein